MSEVALTVKLKDLYSRGLDKAKGGLKQLGAVGKKVGKGLAVGLGVATAAMGALFAAGSKLVGLYQVQAQAEAKLKAAQEASGYASGLTTNELKKQASQMQRLTGVADEVIISTQGMIATFHNIKGDNFKRTTEAVLDFAASQQKAGAAASEVEQRSIMLARALDNPIQNLVMLTRVGITFTDQQKEQIKSLQKAGDMAGAQNIILEQLEGRFGGTAEAMNKANMGVKDFKNVLGDLGEQVGKAIVDNAEFGGVMEKVNGVLRDLQQSGYIELWAEKAKQAIEDMLPVVSKVIGGIAKISGVIKSGIQKTAAFAGGFAGGQGGLMSRTTSGFEMAMDVDRLAKEQQDADRKRIAAIKAEKSAKEAAEDAKERAIMATGAAAESVGATEAEVTEEKEAQVEVSEKGLDTAKAELDVAEKRLEVEKEIATIEPDIDRARDAMGRSARVGGSTPGQTRVGTYDLSAGAIKPQGTGPASLAMAANAEARRIEKIMEALRGGDSGQDQKHLEDIALTNRQIADQIAGRISLG